MTIIQYARIPERIDNSPTEQFTRITPPIPAQVTSALAWSAVDVKPTTCPSWCSHHIDTSPTDLTFHTSATTELQVGVAASQLGTIDLCVERLDEPDLRGQSFVRMGQDMLSPAEARRVAATLVYFAALAEGGAR